MSLIVVLVLAFKSFSQMRKFDKKIPKFEDYFQIKQEDGKDVLYMDNRLNLVLSHIGKTLFQSAKMSMLQGLGADVKLEKGLEGALAKDFVDNNVPLLNLAGDIIGFNTKQYIAKHPRAIGQLASLALPFINQFAKKGGSPLGNIQGNSQGNVMK